LSSKRPAVFDEIASLRTEAINPRTTRIDKASTLGILKAINREDLLVAPAVGRNLAGIARAVEMVVTAIRRGGRVFYVGAGTSGRLGVLDAAECPPTFGTPPELFQAIIAGGRGAVFRAREGSEDRRGEARRAIALKGVGPKDVVVGLAACRRTPFVLAALERARKAGAPTVYITCNPTAGAGSGKSARAGSTGPEIADLVIAIDVGPEVIMGSTRMKAGTAEKMALNMISTAAMIKLGKVCGNLMVDLRPTSEKLRQRTLRILMLATGCDYAAAVRRLKAAKGNLKTAIRMSGPASKPASRRHPLPGRRPPGRRLPGRRPPGRRRR
jgi:N-acetylmuramic acid 6-phosphate etherase